MSKVVEKLALLLLSLYMENKLPACKYKFRPDTLAGVPMALGAWAKATGVGRVMKVAARNLTAAFDNTDHGLLCQKLSVLGVGTLRVR